MFSPIVSHGIDSVTALPHLAQLVTPKSGFGEITAAQRIEIRPSAKISGNLAVPRMVMHEGAVFEGHCAMKPEE